MKTKRLPILGGFTRFLLVSIALLSMPAFAQDVALIRTGNTEIGGFFGGSYGLDSWRGMGGGNVAYAATRFILPYVEYSYFPGIVRTGTIAVPGFGDATFRTSVPLSDFHGGIHLRFPKGQTPVVPYLVAGAGVIGYRDTDATVAIPGITQTFTQRINGTSDFAANFGAGLRYYTTERLGFRVEFKGYKPTGTYTDPFYKVTVGIFFQIR